MLVVSTCVYVINVFVHIHTYIIFSLYVGSSEYSNKLLRERSNN